MLSSDVGVAAIWSITESPQPASRCFSVKRLPSSEYRPVSWVFTALAALIWSAWTFLLRVADEIALIRRLRNFCFHSALIGFFSTHCGPLLRALFT